MSIGGLTEQNTRVLDLFKASPTAPEPRAAGDRSDGTREAREGGFDRAMRESASPKRTTREAEPIETRETAERSGSESDASAQPKEASASGDGKSLNDDAPRETEAAKPAETSDDSKPQGDAETGGAEQAEQAQAEASLDAQAQAVQAGAQLQASQQAQVQDAATKPSGDEQAQAAASNAKQQAQAALQHAAGQTQAQAQSQQQATAAQSATASAVQPIVQQDTQAQAGNDEARGESSSTNQAATAGKTAGNAGVANAAFTVPDQGGNEARLPINTPANAQQIDAAKAVQAQPIIQQDDNDALNTARLTRGLASAVQQRGGAVTLRLTPPEMGTVRIQMQITGTNLSASFHAESASAQTLLTQQLSQLRTALESQGMNVEKLSVQPLAATAQSSSTSQNQNQNDNQQQQQNQAQQQSANDGRSRGQYSGDSSGGQQGGDAATQQHQQRRGFFDQLSDAAEPAAA